MSNTINVNYMSTMVNRYSSAYTKKLSNVDNSEAMTEALNRVSSEQTESIVGTETIKLTSKEDMTLDEYREYISNKIASFPLHPSQMGNSFAINISDVSLQKMKDDSEYEEWLLNDVKGALGSAVPEWYQAIGGPSTYCVLNYENGEKGCWCHMWSTGYKGGKTDAKTMFDNESKDSVYTRKAEQKKQIEKDIQKKAQQKRIREKELAKEALETKMRNQEYLRDYYNQKYYKDSKVTPSWQPAAMIDSPFSTTIPTLADAISAYESAAFMVQ